MKWKPVLAACAVAVALCGSAAHAQSSCATPGNLSQLGSAIASGLNQSRQSASLRQLRPSGALMTAAQAHACDMSRNNFFDHRGSDGSDVRVRARRAGYRDCLIAENLAWGYPDPWQIISGWLASRAHRQNMMLGNVSEFGIGVAQGARGPIWVLVVARNC